MMKRFSITAFFALLFSLAACQSRADWNGVYVFSENLGEDPGGAAMLVQYRLELGADRCLLDISGYQSDTHIHCALDTDDNAAVIRFRSYDNGEVKNIYGVQVYQVGEPLFRLRSSANSGELVTEWQSLSPDSIEEKTGNYFTRQ